MKEEEAVLAALAHQAGEVDKMLGAIDNVPAEDRCEFLRVLLAVGSCFTNKTNHGVFLLVENEEMLKIYGVNSTSMEAAHITTQAADMFVSNEVANELQRRGETH